MGKQKEEEEKKDRTAILLEERKKAISNLVLIFATAFVVLIGILTMAWFANNNKVNGTNMSVTVSSFPFEIATKGSNVRNDDFLTARRSEYKYGLQYGEYYETGDETNSIKLRYNASDGKSEIGPGGFGKLNLYIIPKTNDAQIIQISLNVISFAEIEKKDIDGNLIYKMNNNEFVLDSMGNKIVDTDIYEVTTAQELAVKIQTTDKSLNASEALARANECATAASYLQGRIMFFGEQGTAFSTQTQNGQQATPYYYKTPYTDRTISVSVSINQQNQQIPIPIYWMWPNTLGQILLDGNHGIRSGYPLVEDANSTERAKMVKYLKDNKSLVFANTEQINDNVIESPLSDDNFKLMSTQYNNADFKVGTTIAYFMIEVIAESVSGNAG